MQKFIDIPPFAYLLLGFVLGLLIYGFFLKPEIETKIVETIKIKTDTVYIHHTETIVKTKFKYIYERDTIIEKYQPKIRGFKELYPFLYGNVSVNGEVLGELRYMDVSTDFKLPVITNQITKEKTVTNTIIQKGIFIGGGFSNTFDYSLGAGYLGKDFMVNLNYYPNPSFSDRAFISTDIKINLFR